MNSDKVEAKCPFSAAAAVGTTNRDLSTTIFGHTYHSPLFMAPIGVTGICTQDQHGDVAAAQASAMTGVAMTVSTLGNDTLVMSLAMQALKHGEVARARRLIAERFGSGINDLHSVFSHRARYSTDPGSLRLSQRVETIRMGKAIADPTQRLRQVLLVIVADPCEAHAPPDDEPNRTAAAGDANNGI